MFRRKYRINLENIQSINMQMDIMREEEAAEFFIKEYSIWEGRHGGVTFFPALSFPLLPSYDLAEEIQFQC